MRYRDNKTNITAKKLMPSAKKTIEIITPFQREKKEKQKKLCKKFGTLKQKNIICAPLEKTLFFKT